MPHFAGNMVHSNNFFSLFVQLLSTIQIKHSQLAIAEVSMQIKIHCCFELCVCRFFANIQYQKAEQLNCALIMNRLVYWDGTG